MSEDEARKVTRARVDISTFGFDAHLWLEEQRAAFAKEFGYPIELHAENQKRVANTMKVVINRCYGGFGLSEEAKTWIRENGGPDIKYDHQIADSDSERANTVLVKCVETMREKANGKFANLKIVEVPDDVNWCIEEYDGCEHVAEVHRTWGEE